MYIFKPNVQILHMSIYKTYPANFITATDMVQRILQFKVFKVHFSSEHAVAH